jgi:hypothetical protein
MADTHDSDIHKGAVENESRKQPTNTSLKGQLGHRTSNEMVKDNDTDFPEPGENPEHTGQDQDPGHRQKMNQNQTKEDPLAS